jgi:hypothetical protein
MKCGNMLAWTRAKTRNRNTNIIPMIICPREDVFASTRFFLRKWVSETPDGAGGSRMIRSLSRPQYLSYRGNPHGGPVPRAKFGPNRCYGLEYCLALEWLYAGLGFVIRFVDYLHIYPLPARKYEYNSLIGLHTL